METKYYRMTFDSHHAGQDLDLDQLSNDIQEAVSYASRNLISRFGVLLELIAVNGPYDIIVSVNDCPHLEHLEKGDWNNPGKRLKGIPSYLLKTYPERYKKLRVGNRLLNYYPATFVKSWKEDF